MLPSCSEVGDRGRHMVHKGRVWSLSRTKTIHLVKQEQNQSRGAEMQLGEKVVIK